MRQVILKKFMRITKWEAEKLYDSGESLIVCPVNLRPGEPHNPEIILRKNPAYILDFDKELTLETILRDVTHYNCINKETGKYLAYYRATNHHYIPCDGITFSE